MSLLVPSFPLGLPATAPPTRLSAGCYSSICARRTFSPVELNLSGIFHTYATTKKSPGMQADAQSKGPLPPSINRQTVYSISVGWKG
ncbi:hypothetical protein BDV30DRAFT_217380 [Aspergillus minisclerotigenes]|uniref:Uncharacterized protein n=1 Tax=Aspergillus minisclerotigenes TaxID=656917 RepID=A0A5N6IS53_9EURO|nr:hypothetical protein BDV30DRAFT_217380 [Aspergillus minisclerotigenes]